ncbi:MAG: hypothetical protein JWP97_2406 [Labilithrix sp.]|nr:hypothetical protein [Labilithrix sp.]
MLAYAVPNAGPASGGYAAIAGAGRPWYLDCPMKPPSDDLDLPPLDGNLEDDESEREGDDDDLDDAATRDVPDALDDTTGEGDDLPGLDEEGSPEGGWLVDDEADATMDVGALDVSLGEELPATNVLEAGARDDEPEPIHALDEDLGGDENAPHADGGEEGPLADDEELREEDLPELDADDDGDVDDSTLYEGASIGIEDGEELRWADRAWARVGQTGIPEAAAPAEPDGDDSGMLPVPGDDPKLAARDATWRRLDEAGGVTAVALLPGDSVVLALDAPDRARLVRIQPDGAARIIAEIELPPGDDDRESRVTALRWDAARGSLVASGGFGVQVFQPT